jgi:3-deoxy-D-manno-octulosonic-acid transferase
MMAVYSFLLVVGLALSAPWWGLRMLQTQRYREGLRERLGAVPAALVTAVAGKRVVWVHAVSVGEVLAASRLVDELAEALGEGWTVVVSTTTRTGQALARERFGADRVFYFPLDFAFAVRAFLRVLRPAVFVLMESELWPRMLHECQRSAVPVVVVNARVSDRSFSRGLRVKWVWGRVLRGVSLWLAQSEEDARRLVALGARAESVRLGGNLKFDVRAPKVSRVAELIKEAAGGRPIVVAGSTVGGPESKEANEETIVSNAWMRAAKRCPCLLVVAPRHPERFSEAWSDLAMFPFLSATDLIDGERRTDAEWDFGYGEGLRPVEVIMLNTIGDLAAVYGVADVAVVGGSFVKRGGHNPLEPAQFGVPVVMGPSFENFRGIVESMRAVGGIALLGQNTGVSPLRVTKTKALRSGRDDKFVEVRAVSGEGLEAELEAELVRLLTDREAAKAMGERGRKVFEEQQGATGRAVEAILALVVKA